MQAKRLYLLTGILLTAGYAWLIYNLSMNTATSTVCMFKKVTGIPCPSCGTTRGIDALVHGHWSTAFHTNPFSFLVLMLMLLLPLWLVADLLSNRWSFYKCYLRAELFMKRKTVAVTLIAVVIGNWIWNIYKGI